MAHTDEWHRFRWERGIGGSDIGALRGRNPFHSRWRLWQEKVGLVGSKIALNASMEIGSWQEDFVAKCWTFYDGSMGKDMGKDVPGYILNMNTYRNALAKHEAKGSAEPDEVMNIIHYQQRRCARVNGIIVDDDYPWLYANLDRLIQKDQFRLDGPGMLTERCPLECKTIMGFHAQKYEAGHPPYWHDQGHLQMLLTNSSYCEYAYLKDGNNFNVIAYAKDAAFMKAIVEESRWFWYNHVIPARERWARLTADAHKLSASAQQELLDEIDSFIPEADHSDPAWLEFLKERAQERVSADVYVPEDNEITRQLVKWCRTEEFYRIMVKKAEDMRLAFQSMLATELDNRDRNWMKLPDGYEVSLRPLRAGSKPTLKVKMPRGIKVDDVRLLENLGGVDAETYY